MKVGDVVRYNNPSTTRPKGVSLVDQFMVLCTDEDGDGYIGLKGEDAVSAGKLCPCGKHQWIIRAKNAEIVTEAKSQTTKTNIMTNLIQKFKLITTAEPERSFIEKGIMTHNQDMTAEGKQLFDAFLFEKNKEEFKTEVVDKIELDK